MNLTVYGQTDVGLVRHTNEDAFVIADLATGSALQGEIARFEVGAGGVLLAVSDGMGGARAGEVASALVLESLTRWMANRPSQDPLNLIEAAVESANREVFRASHEPGHEKMGATLTAAFLQGDALHIAEVGDSRAYLLRGGALFQITHDQSYVQALVDAGVMTAADAAQAPMKNLILQAMGQKPAVTVALAKLSLRDRDCFLICSDGLSNKVSSEEMKRVILEAPRMDVACSRLIELAKEHGGEDNITMIIGGVSGDLPRLDVREEISSTLEIVKEFSAPVHG